MDEKARTVTKSCSRQSIIFTASHNPKEWNALKFLNNQGEFISAQDGEEIIDIIKSGDLNFVNVDDLGHYSKVDDAIGYHISKILE